MNETVGRPMEILLIEDSLVDARVTMLALRGRLLHRLTIIRDGAEGLEFLRRQGRFAKAPHPDLILLDLLLPKLSGLELLAEIKDDFELASIPVVVLTSSDDDEARLRCNLLQVDQFITKPVDLEKFLEVVKNLRDHWHADLILPPLE